MAQCKMQYLQCASNKDTAVLHLAIDMNYEDGGSTTLCIQFALPCRPDLNIEHVEEWYVEGCFEIEGLLFRICIEI